MQKSYLIVVIIMMSVAMVTVSAHAVRINFSYDSDGKVTSAQYDDNVTINYTYDADGNLVKRNTTSQNTPPIIDSFTADPTSGDVPLTVAFTCTAHSPDSSIVSYKWDFDGDDRYDTETTEGKEEYTYSDYGIYRATVAVVDNDNKTATKIIIIKVRPKNGDCINTSYSANETITVITDNSTINDATISDMTQPDNAPTGVEVKKKIELALTLTSGVRSTVVTIRDIPTVSNMVFYKYINGEFIDLTDNSACDNCNFKRTDNSTTNTTTISFTITGGGILDADGAVNGKIQDPIVVATKQTSTSSSNNGISSSGGGGGCNMSDSPRGDLILLFLAIIGFGIIRKRPIRNR